MKKTYENDFTESEKKFSALLKETIAKHPEFDKYRMRPVDYSFMNEPVKRRSRFQYWVPIIGVCIFVTVLVKIYGKISDRMK